MSFQLQGGNAANNDYDYQSGSGIDSFMSRAIDEVSWQTNLASTYTSLAQLPIGLMATTNTPTNYNATQLSGAQSGTVSLGGSGGGSGGLQLNSSTNQITLSDGTNTRLILGAGSF